MRILMIAPEPFLEPRGTPFSVYHRAKALIALGYEVDLVTYPIGQQVRLPGLRIYRVPRIPFLRQVKIGPSLAKLPLDALLFLAAAWRLCCGWREESNKGVPSYPGACPKSRRRYRYLHTHEEAGLMGVVLSLLFGCKHLYDMHSDLAQQMSNFAFTRSKRLIGLIAAIQRLVVRKSDAVIAICPDLEGAVKHMAPNKAVYMIENVAVDEALPPADEHAAGRLRQQWKLGDGPVLLYTGTFESYQGIELLLRSVAPVCAEFPAARYVLVGGKPEQVEKQKLLAQELAIADQVCFVGQRPLEEMPQYMALADILLSPRSEGTNTPLKLYTYLRSGKPILATAIHSHTQILTARMAKLVAPTAEGLAQGALELLRGPQQARELGAYGKYIADEHYSWPAFLEKHRQAYSEFAGKPLGKR